MKLLKTTLALCVALLLFSCDKQENKFEILDSQKTYEFEASGGTVFASVLTNLQFVAHCDADWVLLETYADNTNNNLRITVSENKNAIKRTTQVVIEAEGFDALSISLEQKAADPFIRPSVKEIKLSKNDTAVEFSVEANAPFTITLPSWLKNADGADNTTIIGTKTYRFEVASVLEEEFREANIVLKTDGMDPVNITISQTGDPVPVFEDNFDWTLNQNYAYFLSRSYPAQNKGNAHYMNWPQEGKDKGYSSTIYIGIGGYDASENAPMAKTCDGFLSLPYYAKRPTNLVTPKLTKIKGTKNLEVVFKACTYEGNEKYKEIHVACFGPGTCSVATFEVNNVGYNDRDTKGAWQEDANCTYSFIVTGATSETQIEFHFGPKWPTGANTTEDMASDATCRMGIDDIVITPLAN